MKSIVVKSMDLEIDLEDLKRVNDQLEDIKRQLAGLISHLWIEHLLDRRALDLYDALGYSIERLEQTLDNLQARGKE